MLANFKFLSLKTQKRPTAPGNLQISTFQKKGLLSENRNYPQVPKINKTRKNQRLWDASMKISNFSH